jgi:2-(1,2-epoxy-1,2-dihydrophenyl)acetyl-CoA isomerase
VADVLYEKRPDGIAVITLNRPESMNAMGGRLLPELADRVSEAADDAGVRCVVVTGAGRAFCAGGDVKSMASPEGMAARSSTGSLYHGVRGLQDLERRSSLLLHTMPKPTIAMVNGPAAGAGLSVALACDLRIASDQARFITAFRNVALSGDFGGAYFLPRLVGMGKARELFLLSDMLDAPAALALGIINRVVPHADLEGETMALAAKLASGPTLTFARMKDNRNLAETGDLRALLDQEALNMRLSGQTNDFRAAVQAFVEKRTPEFTGT